MSIFVFLKFFVHLCVRNASKHVYLSIFSPQSCIFVHGSCFFVFRMRQNMIFWSFSVDIHAFLCQERFKTRFFGLGSTFFINFRAFLCLVHAFSCQILTLLHVWSIFYGQNHVFWSFSVDIHAFSCQKRFKTWFFGLGSTFFINFHACLCMFHAFSCQILTFLHDWCIFHGQNHVLWSFSMVIWHVYGFYNGWKWTYGRLPFLHFDL